MITWITIAAIAFLTITIKIYKEEVIIPTRNEQEIEKAESQRCEDIDTLIENALRADSQPFN